MKKNIMVGTAFAVLLCFATACGFVDNRSVATVNGEAIKLSSFNYYLETSKSVVARAAGTQPDANFWATADLNGKKAGDVVKEKALEEAINDVIVGQKAKEMGVVLDDKAKQEIGKKKGEIIQQYGGKEQYEAGLKQYNITDADMQASLEKSYIRQLMLDKLSTQDNAFKVDDAMIKDYVNKNYARARHILIMTIDQQSQQPLPEDAQKAAKDKAEKLLADVKGGADFVKVMEKESQDPGSKSNPDGYIFGKGEMMKEFEDATYSLKVGEISGLVKTSYGYHIIKREELSEGYDKFIADPQNKGKVESEIKNELISNKIAEWKKTAKIEKNEEQFKGIVVK